MMSKSLQINPFVCEQKINDTDIEAQPARMMFWQNPSFHPCRGSETVCHFKVTDMQRGSRPARAVHVMTRNFSLSVLTKVHCVRLPQNMLAMASTRWGLKWYLYCVIITFYWLSCSSQPEECVLLELRCKSCYRFVKWKAALCLAYELGGASSPV